jgi:hypothetical protein
MAQREGSREDLMAEATALRERAELALDGEGASIVAGFHDDGRLSVYFGDDPVYHFDSQGRLRRAFVAGALFRSTGATLARLTRRRTQSVSLLERVELDEAELAAFVDEMRRRLRALHAALVSRSCRVLRRVPEAFEPVQPLVKAVAGILSQHQVLSGRVGR